MKDTLAPAAPIERIRTHLFSLRMPSALEALDHVVQQLECGQTTAIEAIETLLSEELTIRCQRRLNTDPPSPARDATQRCVTACRPASLLGAEVKPRSRAAGRRRRRATEHAKEG